jgi:Leucine-rich repeat (LRR) protein
VDLDLSYNHITSTSRINEVIGNVKFLSLRMTKIVRTKGLNKLYSLERLDLAQNQIDDLEEVLRLKELPFLQILNVDGNPVSTSKEFRIAVLAHFHDEVRQRERERKKEREREGERKRNKREKGREEN